MEIDFVIPDRNIYRVRNTCNYGGTALLVRSPLSLVSASNRLVILLGARVCVRVLCVCVCVCERCVCWGKHLSCLLPFPVLNISCTAHSQVYSAGNLLTYFIFDFEILKEVNFDSLFGNEIRYV